MGDSRSSVGSGSRVDAEATDDIVSRLCRLALLRDRDALTEEEFQSARARLVAGWHSRVARGVARPLAPADDRPT
jgi:hypothetical protein